MSVIIMITFGPLHNDIIIHCQTCKISELISSSFMLTASCALVSEPTSLADDTDSQNAHLKIYFSVVVMPSVGATARSFHPCTAGGFPLRGRLNWISCTCVCAEAVNLPGYRCRQRSVQGGKKRKKWCWRCKVVMKYRGFTTPGRSEPQLMELCFFKRENEWKWNVISGKRLSQRRQRDQGSEWTASKSLFLAVSLIYWCIFCPSI